MAKRTIAYVEGSDNAHSGIEAIGNGRITYVKVGDFNLNQQDIAIIFKFTELIQACISKAVFCR